MQLSSQPVSDVAAVQYTKYADTGKPILVDMS